MEQKWSTTTLLLGSISSLMLTMGIGRFTYTPALPRMQEALGFGDDTAGLLAAANFAGYLSGALLGSRITSPNRKLMLFRTALLLAVLCNALMPLIEDLLAWSFLRYLSGLASAGGMVVGTSLVMEYLSKKGLKDLIGIHFGGVGAGIVLTALLLGGHNTAMPWQQTWWLSSAVGLLFVLPAWLWVKASPVSPDYNPAPAPSLKSHGRPFIYLVISYFFAGGAFAVGATFIISVIQSNPLLVAYDQASWLMVGLAAAPSCYIWVRLGRRFGAFNALLVAFIIQTIGCLTPVLFSNGVAAILGGFCFGFTFMGIVTIVLAMVAKISPNNPARLVGLLVTAYGVGQIAGPIFSGQVMENSGDPTIALWVAALLSLMGAGLLFGAKNLQHDTVETVTFERSEQPCRS